MADKTIKTSDLIADPKNARKRTAQSAHLIKESLKSFGAARSIVIDENDRVLAGNGTIEAANDLGITAVRVIETDGDEIIAVRRKGLDESKKVGLALADNRTSDLSEWDGLMLQQLSVEHDIKPWFSDDDILEILQEDDDGADFDPNDPTIDQSGKIQDIFQIIVNCKTEQQQTELLDRLLEEGYDCKAMNA